MSAARRRIPLLSVVSSQPGSHEAAVAERPGSHRRPSAYLGLDWSILMARTQDGDGSAYRRLLEEVTPHLRSLAARRHRDTSDAEDAVQDILLTLHAVRQTYDPSRPFGPWLFAIANRRLVDRLRRQGWLRSKETMLTLEHETFSQRQANLADRISDRCELETAIGRLPAKQRQAVRLLKLDDLPLKEAAAETGQSVGALKAATHRGLRNLRTMLSNRSEDR
ncbi:sigma-70 family RNA polymerase sigma factor [Tistlia consotensis]|nr:sigma-70 family RNA polymerase sigma factor [Tistlia consotensis]